MTGPDPHPSQLSGLSAQIGGPRYQGLATFAQRPFVAEPKDLDLLRPDVAIVGAPWDGSSWYRSGSRFAPRWLRAAALNPGTYHLELGIEIFQGLSVIDFGDAFCPHGMIVESHANIRERVYEIARRGIVPVVIGGDHSITWPSATAVADHYGYGRVGLLHFDAHADTAPSIDGNLASHGTPMRRLLESGAVRPDSFIQIGLRGYWPDEAIFRWMGQQGLRWYLMSDVHRLGIRAVIEQSLRHLLDNCDAIYLSVDIDVLDPGYAPGTGTPEPGGMNPLDLLTAIRELALDAPIVAMDLVEVSPAYDHADVTTNNAQRIIMEFLAGMSAKHHRANGHALGRVSNPPGGEGWL